MGRKLASIQRIWKIEPIEGADRIELVRVMGWQCIAKKEEFEKYDLCVYIEIDSVCPKEDERFAMLASTNWKVKTRKMKNTLSQGIALPLSLFGWTDADVTLEEDVSEKLGIKLFENYETFNAVEAKGGFPGFIRKTDQERSANLSQKTYENYSKMKFEVTEKCEGSSSTWFLRDNEFFACSRNLVMRLIDGSRWKYLNYKYNLENKLKTYGKNIAIQAEILGPGIQKNYYGLSSYEIKIFDVFDIDAQRYLNPDERYKVLEELGLMHIHVPIVHKEFSFEGITHDELMKLANGKSMISSNKIREGLVYKCISNGDYHFKTVDPIYLLKEDQ
jgi:RNA ligase (TIGR02306 family)